MNSIPLLSFQWYVSTVNYTPMIINSEGYLLQTSAQNFHRQYAEHYQSALTNFINIPEDNLINKIIEFANKYGLLTKGKSISDVFKHNPKSFFISSCEIAGSSLKQKQQLPINDDILYDSVEPIKLWFDTYHHLKTIVLAWESIQNRKVKLKVIDHADPSWRNPSKPQQGVEITWPYKNNHSYQYSFVYDNSLGIYGKIGSQEGFDKDLFQKDDTLGPATFAIQHEINKRLDEYPCRFHVMYDARSIKKPSLAYQTIPVNLLGMLWLQAAQLVCGERTFMRCEFCHQWGDVTGSKIKKNVHPWCSGTNRKKQSRQKYDDMIFEAYISSGSIDMVADQFHETPRKVKAVIRKKEVDENAE